MIDRSTAPGLSEIDSISFVAPDIIAINERVNLYHMKEVPNETARFELYFDAGKIRGNDNISSFVNGLLLSGTNTKSAIQIQEEINALGGYIDTGMSVENCVISMYCLRENLEALFDIVMHAIEGVEFFEDEVSDLLADRLQKLHISREKVSYLAQTNFQQELFASEPNYSRVVSEEDFGKVTVDSLKTFHKEHYLKGLQRVVIVGDIQKDVITRIAERIAPFAVSNEEYFSNSLSNTPGKTTVEKKDALQSAIRVGRILFNKNHPDYNEFLVLNTILGDYFGSRLMSNIREDKGYTYGIGSMVAELQNTGYFLIATEVGSDVKEAALNEIKAELLRLQTELIEESELELVRNYMRGQLLKSADGPYAMMDLFLSAELHGKDLEFYNESLAAINEVTPERIRELALHYLNWEDLTIVTAG